MFAKSMSTLQLAAFNEWLKKIRVQSEPHVLLDRSAKKRERDAMQKWPLSRQSNVNYRE